MMLEEKGREMAGKMVELVQDERRGAREEVDRANRRQLVKMTWPSTEISLRSLSSLAQLSIAAVSKEWCSAAEYCSLYVILAGSLKKCIQAV